MRKIVLSLAAAGAALAVASPAAAQYYPQPQPYGYNGYANGYGSNWGEARALQMRIDNVERQARRLDRFGDRRGDRLLYEAQRLEQRLRWQARDGLNPWEARELRARVDQLEQQVRQSYAYGYGRDRDDRWDRDDRRDHDDGGDRDGRWGDRDRD